MLVPCQRPVTGAEHLGTRADLHRTTASSGAIVPHSACRGVRPNVALSGPPGPVSTRKRRRSHMASTGKTSAEVLADFVHRTGYDDLPGDAIAMLRKMILDQLGDQLASAA